MNCAAVRKRKECKEINNDGHGKENRCAWKRYVSIRKKHESVRERCLCSRKRNDSIRTEHEHDRKTNEALWKKTAGFMKRNESNRMNADWFRKTNACIRKRHKNRKNIKNRIKTRKSKKDGTGQIKNTIKNQTERNKQ